MALITTPAWKLIIQLMLFFGAISECSNNGATSVHGGEIRRSFISPLETINKVTLTQKGYIQFLKYVADMPPLSEFTFCIWMRSDSFNFSHPLFSYSQNEKDRLIRVWISDKGMYVNMAILEEDVFRIPINVRENHWNHFCPSWNAKSATWSFYYNGKLMQTGLNYKLHNLIIPGQGDIVVGQEYTDFNKGLDDGIEGDVFAFNFVASSTMPASKHFYPSKGTNYRRQMYIPSYTEFVLKPTQAVSETPVLGYFTTRTRTRSPKGIFDFGQAMLQKFYSLFDMPSRVRFPLDLFGQSPPNTPPIKRVYKNNNALENNMNEDKTLGMFLVELSYENCALGRGAPLLDDKIIVSWTKTPVRVFGGAILKTVTPFCKKF